MRLDSRTGLLRRAAFIESAKARAALPLKAGLRAVAYLAPDGFDNVERDYGPIVAEEVLDALSRRVQEQLQPGDLAGWILQDKLQVRLQLQLRADDVLGAHRRAGRAGPCATRTGDGRRPEVAQLLLSADAERLARLAAGMLLFAMVVLVAYAFNAGATTSSWDGFSLRWFHAAAGNERIVDATLRSLKRQLYPRWTGLVACSREPDDAADLELAGTSVSMTTGRAAARSSE